MRVSNFFGTRTDLEEVGIEIEAEFEEGGEIWFGDRTWRAENDGSLRGRSIEYVLQTPINRNDVVRSIDTIKKALSRSKIKIANSLRAGVHVHVNVNDLNFDNLLKFIVCYFVLEIPLVEWCGPNRVGNQFCLRACDAEFLVDEIIRAYRNNDYFLFDNNNIRYSALNLMALPKYGSLEFRALQTDTKLERIAPWVEILLRIKDFSQEIREIESLFTEFSEKTPIEWTKEVVGEDMFQTFFKDQPNLEQDLMTGMRIAQDIIFFSRN